MCGIVGITTGNFYGNDESFFQQALMCDTLRGAHSTGVIGIEGKNKPFLHKRAIDGFKFVGTRPFSNMLNEAVKSVEPVTLIGHNRYATMGAKTASNAHPFRHNKVVGVHNGTVTNYKTINEGKGKHFGVDSEAVIYALATCKGDYKKVLEELTGTFALVWHDYHTNKLHIARNKDRPMALAYNTIGNTVCFASEKLMLNWLVSRNYKHQNFKSLDIPDNEMWTFDLSSKKAVYETKEVTPFVPKSQTYTVRQQAKHSPATTRTNNSTKTCSPQPNGSTNLPVLPRRFKDVSSNTPATAHHNITKETVASLGLLAGDREEVVLTSFRYWSHVGDNTGRAYGHLVCDKDIRVEIDCRDKDFDKGKAVTVKIPTFFSERNSSKFLQCYYLEDIKPEATEFVHTYNDTVSLKAFELASKNGCAFCTEVIPTSTANDCLYLDKGGDQAVVFCAGCTENKPWEGTTHAS